MKELADVLKRFCLGFGRGEIDIGDIKYVDEAEVFDFPFELKISKELDFFYSHVIFIEPVYVGRATYLKIENRDNLIGALEGWRWVYDTQGNQSINPDWDDSWIIIGDKNGDALFVNTSEEGSPVYGSIQNDQFKIANSLSRFFDVYSDWMKCEFVEFDMEADDDDFELKPEFLARIQILAQTKLNDEEVAGFMKFFYE